MQRHADICFSGKAFLKGLRKMTTNPPKFSGNWTLLLMCLSLHIRRNASLTMCCERENIASIWKNRVFWWFFWWFFFSPPFQARNILYKKNLELDLLPLALKRVRKISRKIRTVCLCFGDGS